MADLREILPDEDVLHEEKQRNKKNRNNILSGGLRKMSIKCPLGMLQIVRYVNVRSL